MKKPFIIIVLLILAGCSSPTAPDRSQVVFFLSNSYEPNHKNTADTVFMDINDSVGITIPMYQHALKVHNGDYIHIYSKTSVFVIDSVKRFPSWDFTVNTKGMPNEFLIRNDTMYYTITEYNAHWTPDTTAAH